MGGQRRGGVVQGEGAVTSTTANPTGRRDGTARGLRVPEDETTARGLRVLEYETTRLADLARRRTARRRSVHADGRTKPWLVAVSGRCAAPTWGRTARGLRVPEDETTARGLRVPEYETTRLADLARRRTARRRSVHADGRTKPWLVAVSGRCAAPTWGWRAEARLAGRQAATRRSHRTERLAANAGRCAALTWGWRAEVRLAGRQAAKAVIASDGAPRGQRGKPCGTDRACEWCAAESSISTDRDRVADERGGDLR